MTDLQNAVKHLEGHSVCLCKNGDIVTADGKGVSPIMRLIAEEKRFDGYAAADEVVGKAAAMLLVKLGVTGVYGRIMSQPAKAFLDSRGIACSYDTLTERIMNRTGTDMCPMEKTVIDTDDEQEAHKRLTETLAQMRRQQGSA